MIMPTFDRVRKSFVVLVDRDGRGRRLPAEDAQVHDQRRLLHRGVRGRGRDKPLPGGPGDEVARQQRRGSVQRIGRIEFGGGYGALPAGLDVLQAGQRAKGEEIDLVAIGHGRVAIAAGNLLALDLRVGTGRRRPARIGGDHRIDGATQRRVQGRPVRTLDAEGLCRRRQGAGQQKQSQKSRNTTAKPITPSSRHLTLLPGAPAKTHWPQLTESIQPATTRTFRRHPGLPHSRCRIGCSACLWRCYLPHRPANGTKSGISPRRRWCYSIAPGQKAAKNALIEAERALRGMHSCDIRGSRL